MTAQDWSDSITPEEWAAQRLGLLRDHLVARADLDKIPAPVPLVEHWLTMASLNWLFGDRGSFKSFLAIDFAGSVGTGLPWHGHAVKQHPVLYVALEGASGLQQRVEAWEDWAGQQMTGVHFLVPRSLQIVDEATPVAALCAELQAGLVIIDTQNRATVGLEENSSIDMGRMIAALDRVQQATGSCVLVIHHTAAGSHRPRGHTSIDAAAAAMIRVACDGGLVKVTNEKQKDGPRAGMLLLNASPRLASVVLAADTGAILTDSMRTVLAALRNLVGADGPPSYVTLKRACTSQGMPEGTFNWAARELRNKGLIEKTGPKSAARYQLVDARQGKLDGMPEGTSPNGSEPPEQVEDTGPVPSAWGPGTAGEEANV